MPGGEVPGEEKILTRFSSPRQHCYAIKFVPLPICPVSVYQALVIIRGETGRSNAAIGYQKAYFLC